MAAHIGQPAPSRRFIKIYLFTWGLLAVGALAYLLFLTFPPQAVSPRQAAVKPRGSDTKAIAEVKGSLGEIRKDVTELKTAVGERVENEKVVKTRLTALEDKVSTIATPPEGGAKDKDAATEGDAAGVTLGDAAAKSQAETVSPPAEKAGEKVGDKTGDRPPFVPIETGSLQPKPEAKAEAKEEIVFGEPVVTKGGQEFAVQLAAAPSLNALKQSWGQLSERHAGALGSLRPRVISPRGEGGIYRLIVGPLPSKADAERVCSELRVGPKACFATPYAGVPL
jgi:cell division septation protein DedD